jgi:hypothetical protein
MSWWKHKHLRFGGGSQTGDYESELETSLCHYLFPGGVSVYSQTTTGSYLLNFGILLVSMTDESQ